MRTRRQVVRRRMYPSALKNAVLVGSFTAAILVLRRARTVPSCFATAAQTLIAVSWWTICHCGSAQVRKVPLLDRRYRTGLRSNWNRIPNRHPIVPAEDETEVDLSGAMGSDTASLSQVNGSGGGGMAFTDCLESPVFETPRATLSPESKLTLPRAPIWRWFRPPRIGL